MSDATQGDPADLTLPPPPAAPPSSGVVEEEMPPEPSGDGGEEAGDQAGEVPPDPSEAFASEAGEPNYYYDETIRAFWIQNSQKTWVNLNETGMKRRLKIDRGLRDKPNPGKVISPLDVEISRIENERRVAYAGILAGYRSGVYKVAGRRVLITEDPVLITPKQGDWPILARFFEGLLVGREPVGDGKFQDIDQRPHFFGWLQHVVSCLYGGHIEPGLALGLGGEPDCGKSFLALVLRWILGDRVGKPYAAMTGQDQFNRDAAEAVMQLVDDENQADTRLDMRQKFASEIKKFVANNEFRLRAMHKDGFAVEVLRRLVILVNMQGITVMPPLDGDVDDKVMLFKGYSRPRPPHPITEDTPAEQACWPAPMPTRNVRERALYRDTVRAELPAFLWWLLKEYKMPSHITGGRFVVRHWHHPQIVAELQELSPHTRLWDLIIRSKVVFGRFVGDGVGGSMYETVREWQGTAGALEELLKKGESSQLSPDERREIPAANWLAKRLKLCERHFGQEFCVQSRDAQAKTWTLRPRPQDLAELK